MISRVYDLARQIAHDPAHVFLNPEAIIDVASAIKLAPPSPLEGVPQIGNITLTEKDVVLYELTSNAVMYCFWYGTHRYRPAATDDVAQCMATAWNSAGKWGPKFINILIAEMTQARFTMMNERRMMLLELLVPTISLCGFVDIVVREGSCRGCKTDFDGLVTEMIRSYPGYGSDQFLKRAILFFMMLHRRFGWFANNIGTLPIPTDYQIPKMLHAMKVLRYSPRLESMILDGDIIPAGSRMETELRASSIVACSKIADIARVTTETVDNYLWSRRKKCLEPHHLTITTDY